jgi:hypothetical protein
MNAYYDNYRKKSNITPNKKLIIFDKIRGPLDLTPFIESYKEKYNIDQHKDIFGWSEFIRKYENGGEIYYYEYGFKSFAGEAGYVLINKNKVVCKVTTAFQ